jgi:hypothetical protein
MNASEKAKADYKYRSEILTNHLRRDVWQTIARALELSGSIGLAQDINEFLESKESN